MRAHALITFFRTTPPHKTNLVFSYRTVLLRFVESLGVLNGVRRVSASELVFFRSVIRVSTVR